MNEKYLVHGEAIEKLRDLAEEINVCLLCTVGQEEEGSAYRPMSTKEVDEEGNILFFSDKDSEKNKEIGEDPRVRLIYSHPGKSSFLVVTGKAEIIVDQHKIDALWNALDKTWFKGGKDDPAISIIRVRPDHAHYWDVKGNQMVNFLKMAASAVTGKTLVKGEEGTLKV